MALQQCRNILGDLQKVPAAGCSGELLLGALEKVTESVGVACLGSTQAISTFFILRPKVDNLDGML